MYSQMEFELPAPRSFYSAIADGDWVYLLEVSGTFEKVNVVTGEVLQLEGVSSRLQTCKLIKC